MITALLAAALSLTESDITFAGRGGFELVGVLERPTNAKEPVGVCLLLPGSGPTDRNGNQPPTVVTNLLRDVAATLREAGWATFRFDKRAVHRYASKWPKAPAEWGDFFGWKSHVEDIEAAWRTMLAQPGIDPKRTAILGHSEGGTFSIAVAKDLRPARLILLGTPGRPLGDVIIEQITAAVQRQTQDEAIRKQYIDATKACVESLKKDGTLPADVPAGLKLLFNDSTRDLLSGISRFDPAPALAAYPGEVLLMNGEFDSQISATRDFQRLADALASRKEKAYVAHVIAGASHNFKAVKTMSDVGWAGPVVPEVLTHLREFVATQN